MKVKISVSMDEELIKKAEEKLKSGKFRNKSHIIEYSLKSFLGEDDDS